MSKCGLVLVAWLSCLSQAHADRVADLPPHRQGLIAPIAVQRLAELPVASAERIRATRERVSELLADPISDAGNRELAEGFGQLGALYAAGRLVSPGLMAFENAQRLAPQAFRWFYLAAHVALEQGSAQRALDWLDRAWLLDPNYPPLELRRAESLLSLNRLAEAKESYASVSASEMRAASLYGLAQIDLMERDWSGAAQKLVETLDLQPQASAAHYNLAQALLRLGKRTEAQSHLAKRGSRKPDYPDALVEELRALQHRARFQFEQAMQGVNRGDYANAAAAFATGLREDPTNVRARASYSRTLWVAGDRAQAIAEMRRATEDGPAETLPHFLLAVAEEAQGKVEAAEAGYRAVLALDPRHQGALSYLGRLLLRQGRYSEAGESLAEAIEAGAKLMPIYLHYWAALRGAQFADAQLLQRLQAFDQRFPEPPVFRYLQAKLLATSADADVRDRERAAQIAQGLYDAAPISEHAELLALTAAVVGDFARASQLLEQPLQQARQTGALVEAERLQALIEGYGARRLPTPLWPLDDPVLVPLPVNTEAAWQNYPVAHPY